MFAALARTVQSQYTAFAFDLFFHGASTWQNSRPLTRRRWRELVAAFLQQQGIEKFSVLGFSMGARFALATARAFPTQVREVFLLAPDGLKLNPWYALAVYPWPTRWLFRQLTLRGSWFDRLAAFLQQRGWVHFSLLRFAQYQMNTPERRARVYFSWITFRRLMFSSRRMATLFNKHDIRVTLIVGIHDPVIPPSYVEEFARRLKHVTLHELECGHHNLISASAALLARANPAP